MTAKNPIQTPESGAAPGLCPACGADLVPGPGASQHCRACGLTRHAAASPAPLADAAQTPPAGAAAAIIGRLEASADPAALLLAARARLAPGAVLYLELGPGGLWAFPRKSLMLLMERCGFRLVRKLARDGRRGLYRRY